MSKAYKINMLALFAGALLGMVLIGVLYLAAPTEDDRVDQFIADNSFRREILFDRMIDVAEQARAIPVGTIDELNVESREEMTTAKMNFIYDELLGSPNSTVAQLDDFPADLKTDFFPSGRSVLMPKIFKTEYGLGDASTLVNSMLEMDNCVFYGLDTLEGFYDSMDRLEYVFLVRFGDRMDPHVKAESFERGYQKAEAFCFEVKSGRLLGGFSFAATNGDEVSVRFHTTQWQSGEASLAVSNELDENLETAFWNKLHEMNPHVSSMFDDHELPYSEETLDHSERLFRVWRSQQSAEATEPTQ